MIRITRRGIGHLWGVPHSFDYEEELANNRIQQVSARDRMILVTLDTTEPSDSRSDLIEDVQTFWGENSPPAETINDSITLLLKIGFIEDTGREK